MNPMQEDEEFDPRAKVLQELMDWARMEEAGGMRERYGKPPRELPPEEAPEGEAGSEPVPGVELTEDGEPPPAEGGEAPLEGGEELEVEKLKAALAAMGG